MQAKILVVDDEPDLQQLIRQTFKRQIRSQEMEFFFAQNGAEALEKLQSSSDIDLVLTDINMPVMDGLTLLSRINDLNSIVKSIIVSAYGDMENIRTAMNRGAFDFVTKPIDLDDLETTIKKSLAELRVLKEGLESRELLAGIQRELSIATQIQTSILPKRFPPFPDRKDLDIYAKMIPAKEVGGDFYDFFQIDDHRIGLAVGDVSGKGVPAAMVMAVSRTLLKATAMKGLATHECMTIVNDILVEETLETMFVTIFYGVFDARERTFEYTNAGHNPPLLLRQNNGVVPVENIGGLFAGALKGLTFESATIKVAPGDVLFMFTDGVTEAQNAEEEDYEVERLSSCLSKVQSKPLPEIIDAVFTEVKSFSNGVPQSDDITCLAFRCLI